MKKIMGFFLLPIFNDDNYNYNLLNIRVLLFTQSWNPGLEEVETQGGNGKQMGERVSEREREEIRGDDSE